MGIALTTSTTATTRGRHQKFSLQLRQLSLQLPYTTKSATTQKRFRFSYARIPKWKEVFLFF